jgi:hypothetical protein
MKRRGQQPAAKGRNAKEENGEVSERYERYEIPEFIQMALNLQ